MSIKEIIKLLRIRFPRCEVEVNSGVGYSGISVYFPSVDTEILVSQEKGETKFYVMVAARSDTIESDGFEIGTFEYVSAAKVVEKVVKGAKRIFKDWDEFEKDNDAAYASIGEERSEYEDGIPGFEDVRPALRKEIGNG